MASPRSCSAVTAPGFNTGSVGVVVLGDFTSAAGVRGRRRGGRPRHRLEVRPAPRRPGIDGAVHDHRVGQVPGGHDGDAPTHRRAPGRAEHELPGGSSTAAGTIRAGRAARAGYQAGRATVARGRRPRRRRSHRTPSSTGPDAPATCSWRSTGTAAFTEQVPAITSAYRPVVGRLRRQRLRRHRLARHRQRPGRHLVVVGRRAPTARSLDVNGVVPPLRRRLRRQRHRRHPLVQHRAWLRRRCGTSAPTAPSRRCGWPRTSSPASRSSATSTATGATTSSGTAPDRPTTSSGGAPARPSAGPT